MAATTNLPMQGLGCTGCTAATPTMFDKSGDPSVRYRRIICGDGIVRRTALCDWCARNEKEVR